MKKTSEKDIFVDDSEFKDTVFAKCKGCGGNMVFDPKSQQLKCLFCATVREFSKDSHVQELDVEAAFTSAETWHNEVISQKCDGCGAIVTLSATETAKTCPYCGNSHVVEIDDLKGLKPNAVYPFQITKQSAIDGIKKWAKKKLFISSTFKKNLKPDNLYGVYEPCFTYDSQTFSNYDGVIGINRTRVVGSGKNRRTYTYTEWRSIYGNHREFFDDITIECSDAISQKDLNKLMPFDNSSLRVFDQSYLNGFMAHRSSSSVRDGWELAKSVIDASLRKSILSGYHYHIVRRLNVDTTHNSVTYKYVLLPIYHVLYKHKKKLYKVLANGSTGKVTGKYPLSILKILIAVLLGLGVLFLLGYLYSKSF